MNPAGGYPHAVRKVVMDEVDSAAMHFPTSKRLAIGVVEVLLLVCLAHPASPQTPASASPPVVSATAQRLYEDARPQLLQVRTLLKGQDSQVSVGSGFIVSDDGHVLTNYHVVSEAALEPNRYRLVYSASDRTEGALQILAFDAIHDLALVKPAKPGALAGHHPLSFHPRDVPLSQGERLHSLGNPLDIGFAVIEGTCTTGTSNGASTRRSSFPAR